MPLALYLREEMSKPLTLVFDKINYTLPNLNSLTWVQLHRIFTDSAGGLLTFLATDELGEGHGLPWPIIGKLSETKIRGIIDEWFKIAGVRPERLAQIEYVLEEYDREFNYDLRRLVGLNGITAWLELPLIEAVDIFAMITEKDPAAWTWVSLRNYAYPLSWDALAGGDTVQALIGKKAANYTRLRKADKLNVEKELEEA